MVNAEVFQSFVDALATAIISRMPSPSQPRVIDNPRRALKKVEPIRTSAIKGKHLNMVCRVERCMIRSKGPRFGFMCEKHSKLPKKQQEAARAEWKKDHPRAYAA